MQNAQSHQAHTPGVGLLDRVWAASLGAVSAGAAVASTVDCSHTRAHWEAHRHRWRQLATVLALACLVVLALTQMAYRVQYSAGSEAASHLSLRAGVVRHEPEHASPSAVVIGSGGGTGVTVAAPTSKVERKAARQASRKAEKHQQKQANRKAAVADAHTGGGASDDGGGHPHTNGDDVPGDSAAAAVGAGSPGGTAAATHQHRELVDCNGRRFTAPSCAIHSFFPSAAQHERLGCEAFLRDGLCDVGQYPTDSGRLSPDLNCSKFAFDNGACIGSSNRSDKARLEVRTRVHTRVIVRTRSATGPTTAWTGVAVALVCCTYAPKCLAGRLNRRRGLCVCASAASVCGKLL
jgi:hypothetical protein